MEVTVKLKHIIIPVIVIFITLFGLIFEIKNTVNNPSFDIAFIYPGTGLAVDSEQKFIWETLNEVQNNYIFDESELMYELISLEHLNANTISESQLETLANKNEVIILLGDSYNKEIKDVSKDYDDTYFVLVNNTSDISGDNIINIDFNTANEIKTAATLLSSVSTTKQALYISTTPAEENIDNYNLFVNNCSGCTVEYYYIANSGDSEKIIQDLTNYFTLGYDIAYVEDSVVYNLAVIAAKDVQVLINEENKKIEESKTTTESQNTTNETQTANITTPTTEQTNVVEEIKPIYLQDKIYVIGNNFDMYAEGVYEDTNLDFAFNEADSSVVYETFTYNLYSTFNTIFTEIINESVTTNSYLLEPIKVSEIKLEIENNSNTEVISTNE